LRAFFIIVIVERWATFVVRPQTCEIEIVGRFISPDFSLGRPEVDWSDRMWHEWLWDAENGAALGAFSRFAGLLFGTGQLVAIGTVESNRHRKQFSSPQYAEQRDSVRSEP
jgi:hypothetical protein